jgi:AspT/YidE/YbjL antiporter-like protein
MSAAYAITYVFGMAGLILCLSFLPRWLRIDIVVEAREYGKRKRLAGGARTSQMLRSPVQPSTRAYRVDKETHTGATIEGLTDEDFSVPGEIQRIKRGEGAFVPAADSRLELGDVVSFVGVEAAHEWAGENPGPEVIDYEVVDRSTESRKVMVASRKMAGRTLDEMNFMAAYHCSLTELTRAGRALPRRPDLANLPSGARNVLMELDLLFFMAGVAVKAGTTIVETFRTSGWQLAVAGAAVTLIPVLVASSLGRYAFKMNGAILMGAITGSMTSAAALKQVQEQAQSQIPMLGYVRAYTFANVLLALAGALIVRF